MRVMHEGRNDRYRIGNHIRMLSRDDIARQSLRNETCHICGEKFQCIQDLNNHRLNIHHLNPTFQCRICGKIFRKFCQMIKHHFRLHTSPLKPCIVCGKEIRLYPNMIRRMKTHHEQTPQKCLYRAIMHLNTMSTPYSL